MKDILPTNKSNSTLLQQNDNSNKTKSPYDNNLDLSIFIPLIISILGFLATRLWFREKEKDEGRERKRAISKIDEEISAIKKILSTNCIIYNTNNTAKANRR